MSRALSITSEVSGSSKPAFNPQWIVSIIIFVLGLFVAGATGYFSTDKSTSQRIAIVETKQDAADKRMDSMEKHFDRLDSKLDTLLSRVPERR